MKSICLLIALAIVISLVSTSKVDFHFKSVEDGNFESVVCQVDDQIEVHLAENPTTGYQWMIPEEKEGFNSIWSLKESTYEQTSTGTQMLGQGGIHTFLLGCDFAGTEHLTFVYGRPELYDRAIKEWQSIGTFDALTMGGKAIQLKITSIR